MARNLISQRVTVRFEEFERYDPMSDRSVIRFMAITNFGTYHAEVPMYEGRSKRVNRERFKQRAIQMIQDGIDPHEISMTEH